MSGEKGNVIPFTQRVPEAVTGVAVDISLMPIEDLQAMYADCKAVVREREAWLEDARGDLQYIGEALAARMGGGGDAS